MLSGLGNTQTEHLRDRKSVVKSGEDTRFAGGYGLDVDEA